MHVRLGLHRHEERHAVDMLRQMRQLIADPAATLSVLMHFERRLEDIAGGARGRFDPFIRAGIKLLTRPAVQFGLVVEQVHLTRAAVHEQLNDAPHFGGMMQTAIEFGTWHFGQRARPAKQISQRDSPETAGRRRQKFAPSVVASWFRNVHEPIGSFHDGFQVSVSMIPSRELPRGVGGK